MRFLLTRKTFPLDDTAVIAAYRSTSDASYLGILFDRYCHLVFAVSMNYLKNEEDSKDAVLHIFEKLAEDLTKYEIRNFSSWLYSITKNYCLKQLREKKFTVNLDEELNRVVSDDTEPDVELNEQLLTHLGEAILSLNEPQQKCVKLFYFEEKSYREIETITGYNYEKVKSYIQNGKRNLKIYLLNKK